jgi:hypothetical protein
MITGVTATTALPESRVPDPQQNKQTTKSTVRVVGEVQHNILYIYDKHGRLVQSSSRSHFIGEV